MAYSKTRNGRTVENGIPEHQILNSKTRIRNAKSRSNCIEYYSHANKSRSVNSSAQVSKLIVVISGEREIQAWYDLHLFAGLLLKRLRKGGIHFYTWIRSCFRGGLSLCVAILTKLIKQITHSN